MKSLKSLRIFTIFLLPFALLVGLQTAAAQDVRSRALKTILDVEWSPDGRFVAQILADGQVQIFDTATQQIATEFVLEEERIMYYGQVDWSADSQLLAIGIGQTITIWDRTSDQVVQSFQGGNGSDLVSFEAGYFIPESFVSLEWNRDTSLLLAGSVSSRITVWSYPSANLQVDQIAGNIPGFWVWLPDETGVTTGERVLGLQTSEFRFLNGTQLPETFNFATPTAIAISNDRTRLTRGTVLGQIEIMDAITGDTITGEKIMDAPINQLVWSPDGTQILTTSRDNVITLVNAQSGEPIEIFRSTEPILSADWSPYGGQIAIGTSALANGVLGANAVARQGSANAELQIIVPDPSLDRLQAIYAQCAAPLTTERGLETALAQADISAFVAQLNALPTGTLPPACVADLIAVAEALKAPSE